MSEIIIHNHMEKDLQERNPEMYPDYDTAPVVEAKEPERGHKRIKLIGATLVIALTVLSCAYLFYLDRQDRASKKTANQSDAPLAADEGDGLFSLALVKQVFGQRVQAEEAVIPSLADQKPKLNELTNLKDFEPALSAEQITALERDGFFLKVNDYITEQEWGNDDFSDTYKHFGGNTNKFFREPENALYISSDAALHFYHILIDRSFQEIEEEKFQPALREMMSALFADSLKRYEEAADEVTKESYERLAAFYLIPLAVLDSATGTVAALDPTSFDTFALYEEAVAKAQKEQGEKALDFLLKGDSYAGKALPPKVKLLAGSELMLIAKADGLADSPLFTPYREYFQNDYSQFKPRSHYTKNATLKSYFISMMWLGRMGFSLDSPDLTRDAIIMSGQIASLSAGGRKLAETYGELYSAIEFFVGEVDDLTPYEYTSLLTKIYGQGVSEEELADETLLEQFRSQAVTELPQPRIVSEAVELFDDGGERDKLLRELMQMRFFGQRFTPDAYIINQLTQGVGAPDPETGQNLPSMSTALMPISVIVPDNKVVSSYVDAWVKAEAPDSDRIIAKKRAGLVEEFSAFDASVWQQNIYWSWLDSYRSLLSGYGQGYPYFMTTDAWQKKNLGTVLGSYAELKHDTLLYAKQSYAELGGGGDNPEKLPPVPLGYVEADHVFWQKINSLARLTADGLKERSLMPEVFAERFSKFIETTSFFVDIAAKELRDEKISEEEFEKLRLSGQVFDSLTAALPGEELSTKDRRAGIIADIHTDSVKSEILYEATGKPHIIFVAVKDKNGARLVRGLAYNHYELKGPLTKRFNDEEWQAIVYGGEGSLPKAGAWSQDLLR
jgi:hypothetical protein